VYRPTTVLASTCGAQASTQSVATRLQLHNGCPADPSAAVVANQSAAFDCSVVEATVVAPGTYWLR